MIYWFAICFFLPICWAPMSVPGSPPLNQSFRLCLSTNNFYYLVVGKKVIEIKCWFMSSCPSPLRSSFFWEGVIFLSIPFCEPNSSLLISNILIKSWNTVLPKHIHLQFLHLSVISLCPLVPIQVSFCTAKYLHDWSMSKSIFLWLLDC